MVTVTPTEQLEKLHSAARRYCMERHFYWATEYSKLSSDGKARAGQSYTKEALSVFPRYNVLNAILTDVERFIPADFDSLNHEREMLSRAGKTAQDLFTTGKQSEIEQQVMSEERERFSSFVEKISTDELEGIILLAYRRVLKETEAKNIHDSLEKIWQARGYFYPLKERSREDLEGFQSAWFDREVDLDKLRQKILARGIERIWELKEYGPEYEIATTLLEPNYGNGGEGFWTSNGFEWLIYTSHESSITFGGWALLDLKSIWPDSERRIWNSPFYDTPSNLLRT